MSVQEILRQDKNVSKTDGLCHSIWKESSEAYNLAGKVGKIGKEVHSKTSFPE